MTKHGNVFYDLVSSFKPQITHETHALSEMSNPQARMNSTYMRTLTCKKRNPAINPYHPKKTEEAQQTKQVESINIPFPPRGSPGKEHAPFSPDQTRKLLLHVKSHPTCPRAPHRSHLNTSRIDAPGGVGDSGYYHRCPVLPTQQVPSCRCCCCRRGCR